MSFNLVNFTLLSMVSKVGIICSRVTTLLFIDRRSLTLERGMCEFPFCLYVNKKYY